MFFFSLKAGKGISDGISVSVLGHFLAVNIVFES